MKTHNIFPVMFLLDGELNLSKGGRLSETQGLDCTAPHRAVRPLQASSPAVLSMVTEPCGRCPLWTLHGTWSTEHVVSCVWLLACGIACPGLTRVALCVGGLLLSVAEPCACVWTQRVSGRCSFSPLGPLCCVAFLAVVSSTPRDTRLQALVRWTSSCLGCRPGGVGISWGCFFAVLSRFPFKCVKKLCCL